MIATILEVIDLQKFFGGIVAANRVNFTVAKQEILAIIGPNGSGKSTILNLVNGFLPVSGGSIWYKGQNITGLSPHYIASLGIGRTFQHSQLFTNMSVVENVMVGRHLKSKSGMVSNAFRMPNARAEEKDILEAAVSRLKVVGLKEQEVFGSPSSLPYGKLKLLEIARALSLEPELLLMDEPAGGLSVREIDELTRLIYAIRSGGMTIVLVEHRMELVMNIADRIIVLNYGEKIAEGSPVDVRTNDRVIAAYLGDSF